MTIEEVEKRLHDIAVAATDYEAAHSMEDSLWRDVLQAIADGKCTDPASIAKAALKSQAIEFSRYCA